MTRVLIRASSPLAEAGLKSLLHSHPALRVMDDASQVDGGTEIVPPPDVVLLAETGTLADPAAQEAIDWAGAGGAAVLLLRNPAAEPVSEALRSGIKAVLASSSDGPEIAAAIEAAAAGLVVLDPAVIEPLLPSSNSAAGSTPGTLAEDLTPRELEVLRLVAAGLGNKEIAARLTISEHTVKFHVASIMGKLGAGSRTEAVTLGIRHGLILI